MGENTTPVLLEQIVSELKGIRKALEALKKTETDDQVLQTAASTIAKAIRESA